MYALKSERVRPVTSLEYFPATEKNNGYPRNPLFAKLTALTNSEWRRKNSGMAFPVFVCGRHLMAGTKVPCEEVNDDADIIIEDTLPDPPHAWIVRLRVSWLYRLSCGVHCEKPIKIPRRPIHLTDACLSVAERRDVFYPFPTATPVHSSGVVVVLRTDVLVMIVKVRKGVDRRDANIASRRTPTPSQSTRSLR